ncbi:MAG: hypothetical protein V4669_04800 [Pseudomonadota bacterium]
MIGLFVLALLAGWLIVTGLITVAIVRAIRFPGSSLLGLLVFPVVAALPFVDEAIGRWQFQRLCATEAKVRVAPNAKSVVAAKRGNSYITELVGYVFPISEQAVSYVDLATGKEFYSFKAFHTPGGFVMRSGLNMGSSKSCWPEKWTSRANGLDIDALLNRGEK